jgi:hypothetical protein
MLKIKKIKAIYEKHGIILNDIQLQDLLRLFDFLVDTSIESLKKSKYAKSNFVHTRFD